MAASLFPNNGKAESSSTLRLPQNRRDAPAALSGRMPIDPAGERP
jgi:hypothetical protein